MAFAIDFGNANSTVTTVIRSGVDVILNEVRGRVFSPKVRDTWTRAASASARPPQPLGASAAVASTAHDECSLRGGCLPACLERRAASCAPTLASSRPAPALPPRAQASKRQNPTIVSFNGTERFLGEPAVTQVRARRRRARGRCATTFSAQVAPHAPPPLPPLPPIPPRRSAPTWTTP